MLNSNLKFYLSFTTLFVGAFIILFLLRSNIKEEISDNIKPKNNVVDFTDISREVGVARPIKGLSIQQSQELSFNVHFGAGWGDIDNDGCIDLYVANPNGKNLLYKNNCDGDFEEVAEKAGIAYEGVSHSVSFGDIENDGCIDIYVANENEPNSLYSNKCDGTFSDITAIAGVAGNDGVPGSVSWADFNNDGLLDIFVANGTASSDSVVESEENFWKLRVVSGQNNLYKNNGDGTFTDVAELAGIAGIEKSIIYSTESENTALEVSGVSFSAAWFHYNDDACIDLIIASDIGVSPLYKNNCDGTFSDITEESGTNIFLYGMGIAIKDLNQDSKQDVFISNGPTDALFMSNNNGFSEKGSTMGLAETIPRIGWGASLFDYDNDQDYDLYVVSGGIFNDEGTENHNMFYKNIEGNFSEATKEAKLENISQSIGLATADFDNDGDIDLYVTNTTKPNNLFRNNLDSKNNWLRVRLKGTDSNSLGIGAKVKLSTLRDDIFDQVKGGLSYASQDDYALHFGLGDNIVELITIEWPSGKTQVISEIEMNRELIITEK